MSSEFIPNSFQTPNAYVDQFMAFLSPEEWKVLSYMVRRIFGFNKRQDRISYKQIMNGIKTKEGERLDYGTGLGMAATKNAVDKLKEFNLIIEVEPNDAHKNAGPLYALQMNSSVVNTAKLMERYKDGEQRKQARMSKAREAIANPALSNTPPSNEQTPHYPIEAPPIYPIEAPPPLMDSVHNNQGKTVENQDGTKVPTPPNSKKPVTKERDIRLDHPAIMAYRDVARLTVPIELRDDIIDCVKDPVLWRRIIHDWMARGWNRQNIAGLLDAYRAGGLIDNRGKQTQPVKMKTIYDARGNPLEVPA